MKKYYLLGDNIDFSYSPIIHQHYFKQNAIVADYRLLDAKNNLGDAIVQLKNEDIYGFNVTMPYKEQIIPYLDNMSETAKKVGSVNTVQVIDGLWIGHNTDVDGFLKSMTYENVLLKGKRILLIGAGGVAKSVAYGLVKANTKTILLYNRTTKRRNKLWTKIKSDFSFSKTMSIFDYRGIVVDVLINTTPLGGHLYPLQSGVDLSSVTTHDVFDVVYAECETPLIKQAKALNKRSVNGIGMLIAQAILAQQIWQDTILDDMTFKNLYEDCKNIIVMKGNKK